MGPGSVLGGNYRLISLLGEGGMGAVWRAEQLNLGGHVAVKVLHEAGVGRPGLRARFESEAKMAASLRGPHVVQVFDFGVDEASGAPFIVMELLDGESLRDRLERSGPLEPAEVARIVTHVAHALERAHDQQIIHRDLKPANIFLVRNADGEVSKVLDFGIAKRPAQFDLGGTTVTGTLLGTPYYMSPEQIQSSRSVDFRSDLWSLAIIAVECLTGKVPFESDNLPGLVLQICGGHATQPSALGRVPAGFDAWFQRATQRDPGQRFESASRFAAALRDVCRANVAPPPVRDEGAALAPALREGSGAARPATAEWLPYQSTSPLSRTAASALLGGQRRRVLRLAAGAGVVALSLSVLLFWQRPRAMRDAPAEPPSAVIQGTQALDPASPQPAQSSEPKPEPAAPRAPAPSSVAPSIAPVHDAHPAEAGAPEPAPAKDVVPAKQPAAPERKRSSPSRAASQATKTAPAQTTATRPKPKATPPKPDTSPRVDPWDVAPDG